VPALVANVPAPVAGTPGWWEQFTGFSDRQKRAAARLASVPVRPEHRWPHEQEQDMMLMPYADLVAACERDVLFACIGMSLRIDSDGAPGEADVRGAKYAGGCAKGIMEDCFRSAELGADVTHATRACEHGIPIACFRAGQRLASELVPGQVPGEPDAIVVLARGCADSGREACARLAELYRYGSGIGKDVTQALRWYRRACDLGGVEQMTEACMSADALEHGKPFP
jgi:hypothetical protein